MRTICYLAFVLASSTQAFQLGAPVAGRPAAQRAPLVCQQAEPPPAAPEEPAPPPDDTCDFPGCVDGRVMGGLAAIDAFAWWPIKAYRPCPQCAASGKRYRRSGQTLDEIAFKKNPAGGYYGDD